MWREAHFNVSFVSLCRKQKQKQSNTMASVPRPELVGEENPSYASLHINTNPANVKSSANVKVSAEPSLPKEPPSDDGYFEPISASVSLAGEGASVRYLEPVNRPYTEGYLEPVKTHSPKHYDAPVPEMGSEVSGEVEATPEYAVANDHMPGRKSEPVYHEINIWGAWCKFLK